MIIQHVYIKGQIGDSLDSEGNTVKGVQLKDVVLQVEANKEAEAFKIHINSPGGSVNIGREIANYISKLDNVTTIAETLCGSIATEIHLAVPVENRKIVEGTEYFIHNPLLQGFTGNADELADASAQVKVFEKEMVSMYVKQTTADKAAIEGLMKAETSLTGEEAETLGFVSEIIPATALKVVAFYDKPKKKKENTKNIDMTDIKKTIADGFLALKVELGITKKPEVKAAMIATDKGELSWEGESALPAVGDVVSVDGEATGEGDYVTDDGTVISVDAESIVTEVVAGEEEEEETVEALKAKMEKMTTDHAAEMEAKDVEFKETLTTELDAFKKEIGSNFVPKAEKKPFNSAKKKKPATILEKVAAKKLEKKERDAEKAEA